METTYTCPKGHASTEPDFCSECGAKIQGAHAAPAAPSDNGKCPDCGADRAADANVFCEVCGHNFAAGAHSEIPVAPASAKIAPPKDEPAAPPPPPKGWAATVAVDPSLREPESPAPPPKGWTASVAVDPSLREPETLAPPPKGWTASVAVDPSLRDSAALPPPKGWTATVAVDPSLREPESPAPPPKGWTASVAVDPSLRKPVAPPPPPKGWTVSVAVDPSLREPESPAPPANVAPFTVTLDKPVSLIGRRSESRAVFPEIALNFDAAVSHRHALLERVDSGALMLRDIGAANGTRLNGKDVPSLVDMPLQDGDQITLGYCTRITVKAVR